MNKLENLPIWIRLPQPSQRCPLTGLSRSYLVELIKPCQRNNRMPPVESKQIVRNGAARGVILINFKSLINFINAQPSPK